MIYNFNKIFIVVALSIGTTCWCSEEQNPNHATEKFDGITLEAPPRPVNGDWAASVSAVGAEWVAIVPYAFCPPDEDRLRFPSPDGKWRWWGEHPNGVITNIKQARENGLKIMLKPQVWFRGKWAGEYKPTDPANWPQWEEDYRAYLAVYRQIAIEHEVELFCLGTELRHSYVNRPAFWRRLIAEFRADYPGELTVAANWDDYHLLEFWDELDYIGVDAYFPLSQDTNPTSATLIKAWKPISATLQSYAEAKGKTILFTEYGYRSVDQTTWNHWEKNDLNKWPLNELAQATAYEALFEALWDEPWFAGGFLWKWHAEPNNSRRSIAKRFTPQGKRAMRPISLYYGGSDPALAGPFPPSE